VVDREIAPRDFRADDERIVRAARGFAVRGGTWGIGVPLDPSTAISNGLGMEWPPRSGRRMLFPEIDRVAWFTPDEARRRLKPTQVPFIDRLVWAVQESTITDDARGAGRQT